MTVHEDALRALVTVLVDGGAPDELTEALDLAQRALALPTELVDEAKATKVLRWYATETNYTYQPRGSFRRMPVLTDGGRRARDVLKGVNPERPRIKDAM